MPAYNTFLYIHIMVYSTLESTFAAAGPCWTIFFSKELIPDCTHSNTLQNYCFSASLKQYRIKAKKVGSDTYFCPYSPSPWASYLNSLRFTLFIYNLRMITLTMGKIIVPRPYKAVVRFKWDNLYNIYHSAWHILKYQCYYPTLP